MPVRPVGDLRAYLAGAWRVRRTLRDLRAGRAGAFAGVAEFEARDGVLLWRETGRVRLGAHEGPARRCLRIVPVAGGAWEVRFADGRPFHALDLTSGRWDAEHPCGPDRYHGRYEILGADAFTVRWGVHGPEADERLFSRYERR